MFYPAISPHDPRFVILGSDMTGSYLTRDSGKSWRMINLRGVPRFFVFDPSNANILYTRTTGLWRSSNAGTTWELVYPDPMTVTGISMIDDHAEERFESADPGAAENIQSLAIHTTDSRHLYALFSNTQRRLTARESTDGGRTWKSMDRESPPGAACIYAAKDGRVHIVASTGPEPFTDVSGAFDEAGGFVAYGAAKGGVYVSRDDGKTWTRTGAAGQFQAIAAAPSRAATAYASYRNLNEGDKQYFGVAKTTDYGATWNPVWKESGKKSPQVDDGWVSERFGAGWGDLPLSLAVAPSNPDLCYATDLGRTLRSSDGGATWTAAYTRRVATGAWTTTGLDVTTTYGVHVDPFDPRHIFIDYTDIGLFASDNGGASWHSATQNGVPRPWINTTYWLVFDPEVRGRIWAVMSGTHDLPRPKMWRRTPVSRFRGGVVRSDDGGKTWRPLTNGMPQTAATHIFIDRRAGSSRRLFVTGFGTGVFRSDDGGDTWNLKNSGLPTEPFAWRMAQDRDGALYVVIARRSEDGSIGSSGDGALYRSRNGGDSWEKVALPEGVNGPNGLAIDPADPRRLYLAAWRRKIEGPNGGGGIYVSADAGATWRHTLANDQHVYDVTIDPENASILYACGFESSAWRSTDRGASWKRIRGYNFKWGHRVIPDPRDRSKVFITTFGGSVWHGPAAGDPNAAEDIVTPAAAFSR